MSTADPDALQQSAFFGEKMSTLVLQQQGQDGQSVKNRLLWRLARAECRQVQFDSSVTSALVRLRSGLQKLSQPPALFTFPKGMTTVERTLESMPLKMQIRPRLFICNL